VAIESKTVIKYINSTIKKLDNMKLQNTDPRNITDMRRSKTMSKREQKEKFLSRKT
jgi:hypothetical protein